MFSSYLTTKSNEKQDKSLFVKERENEQVFFSPQKMYQKTSAWLMGVDCRRRKWIKY